MKHNPKAAELTNLNESLLPCPFCGGEAKLEPRNNWHWYVGCINIYCGGKNWTQLEAGDAVRVWNNRS